MDRGLETQWNSYRIKRGQSIWRCKLTEKKAFPNLGSFGLSVSLPSSMKGLVIVGHLRGECRPSASFPFPGFAILDTTVCLLWENPIRARTLW